MRMSCEETFGPVAPITLFHDEAEVIAQANATPYGLEEYLSVKYIRHGNVGRRNSVK